MRDLKTLTSGNLKGCKEFNHLRVGNIGDFFENYQNQYDYYKSPFAILAELEQKVLFEDYPDQIITIDYKMDGSIIFERVDMYESDGLRVVEYCYNGTIS